MPLWCIENVEEAAWAMRNPDNALRLNVWARRTRLPFAEASSL